MKHLGQQRCLGFFHHILNFNSYTQFIDVSQWHNVRFHACYIIFIPFRSKVHFVLAELACITPNKRVMAYNLQRIESLLLQHFNRKCLGWCEHETLMQCNNHRSTYRYSCIHKFTWKKKCEFIQSAVKMMCVSSTSSLSWFSSAA